MASNPSHGTAVRTAFSTTVKNAVDAGASFGKLNIRESTTILATITLQDPALSISGVVLTLLGVPLVFTAIATGVADNCQILDSDDTLVVAGTCGTSASDFIIDNTSVVSGQTGNITGFTYTPSP